MKNLFALFAVGILTTSLQSHAKAKPCEGSTNANCKVQFFCAEVSPFLIPIEVEIWNTEESLSLHKFAVRSDDTRAEVGAARVRETNLSNKVIYSSAVIPQYQLSIDIYNGDTQFAEDFLGRTLLTPMICLQPLE